MLVAVTSRVSCEPPMRTDSPALAVPTFSADGAFLITGGLGGLGLLVARWLVERGVRHLALVSRHEPTDAARAALEECERAGAKVLVCLADVTDGEALAVALAEVERSLPPVCRDHPRRGDLDDGMLRDQSADRFARVMRPKIAGAWNLHRLTQQWPVQQFVLFSSAAALFGSPGQANHAAANAFLDALAAWRRAQSLPALSIAWGLWSDVGAGSARRFADRMAAAGVGTIRRRRADGACPRARMAKAVRRCVVPVNWTQLIARVGPSPFLSEVAPATVQRGRRAGIVSWATTSAEERQRLLTTLVQTEVARLSALQMHRPSIPRGACSKWGWTR